MAKVHYRALLGSYIAVNKVVMVMLAYWALSWRRGGEVA